MAVLLASLFAAFLPLANGPDRVFAANGGTTNELRRAADGWTDGRVSVRLDAAKVLVASPKDPLETVTLVWNAATDGRAPGIFFWRTGRACMATVSPSVRMRSPTGR